MDSVREALYEVIHLVKAGELKKTLYGSIPFYELGEKTRVRPCGEVFGDNLIEKLSDGFPIEITQSCEYHIVVTLNTYNRNIQFT